MSKTTHHTVVVGATGLLGMEICRGLAAAGREVTALVRPSSDPARRRLLESVGVRLKEGDLKHAESLERLCEGATTLITTASSTLSRAEGDSIESVDRAGLLRLVPAAVAAGVDRIIYVSFPESRLAFPLQSAKREVEAAIRGSGCPHLILQPTHFWEVWFSPALGFDPAKGQAVLFGDGSGKLAWVSMLDVRDAVIEAVAQPEGTAETVILTGPESVGQSEVLERIEAGLGRRCERTGIPLETLRRDYEQAEDPLLKSFAALKLIPALGEWAFEGSGSGGLWRRGRRSIEEHVHAVVGRGGGMV